MRHARSNPQYKSFKTKLNIMTFQLDRAILCITIMNYETNVLNEPSGVH